MNRISKTSNRTFPSLRFRVAWGSRISETIATDQPRSLPRALATGHPHALQTREAKAALERLEGRGAEERPGSEER